MAFNEAPKGSSIRRVWNFAVFSSWDDVENFLQENAYSPDIAEWARRVNEPYPYLDDLLATIEATKSIAKQIDLGGSFTKSKLFITDNPSAVFDFGLASSGLKQLVEFYSRSLAQQYPAAFLSEGYLPGVIPPVLIARDAGSGQYFVEYDNEIFVAERRQMGTTYALTMHPQLRLIEKNGLVFPDIQGNPQIASLLKYTSSQKRSYVEMRKLGGTTPYIDILLPLNLLSGTGTTLQMLSSILPAIVAAQIFEQAGIQTRIHVGRIIFTQPTPRDYPTSPYSLPDACRFTTINLFGNNYDYAETQNYIDIAPPQNRQVLITVKNRGQEVNWNLIANLIANIDLRGGFADFASRIFPNDNRIVATNYTTYTDANLMDLVSKNFGGWLNYINKNDLYGDYRQDGSFTSNGSKYASKETAAKIALTPLQNIIGTFLGNTSYNAVQDLQNGTLTRMNHPFGLFFWRILDRAELMLTANPNKVVTRIYKRLKSEGHDAQMIRSYFEASVLGIVNRMTADPVEAFRNRVREPLAKELEPPFYYPYNEQVKKIINGKAKGLLNAYQNIISKIN